MNNLPVVYLYANLILHCIDAIEYITNVFSIKIPKIQEGEGREWVQATLALHRPCLSPSSLPLSMFDGGSGPHSELPKFRSASVHWLKPKQLTLVETFP